MWTKILCFAGLTPGNRDRCQNGGQVVHSRRCALSADRIVLFLNSLGVAKFSLPRSWAMLRITSPSEEEISLTISSINIIKPKICQCDPKNLMHKRKCRFLLGLERTLQAVGFARALIGRMPDIQHASPHRVTWWSNLTGACEMLGVWNLGAEMAYSRPQPDRNMTLPDQGCLTDRQIAGSQKNTSFHFLLHQHNSKSDSIPVSNQPHINPEASDNHTNNHHDINKSTVSKHRAACIHCICIIQLTCCEMLYLPRMPTANATYNDAAIVLGLPETRLSKSLYTTTPVNFGNQLQRLWISQALKASLVRSVQKVKVNHIRIFDVARKRKIYSRGHLMARPPIVQLLQTLETSLNPSKISLFPEFDANFSRLWSFHYSGPKEGMRDGKLSSFVSNGLAFPCASPEGKSFALKILERGKVLAAAEKAFNKETAANQRATHPRISSTSYFHGQMGVIFSIYGENQLFGSHLNGWRTNEGGHSIQAQLHHDIKPENILCFDDFENGSNTYKLNQSTLQPRQIAETNLGQKWDVWCLGCLYLDFITWAVLGWSGVEAFGEARVEIDETDPGGSTMEEDVFFVKRRVTKRGNQTFRHFDIGVRKFELLHRVALTVCSPALAGFLDYIRSKIEVRDFLHIWMSNQLSLHN
ncbi:hypothetical protein CCUS01_02644 [Colletotrichum cuscutae]|uniref:Protein kinase domain-containing protein n=1 Tax=Colletotrichum cuscutae TaxID=1209917 RepID=A0AAI9YDG9_9PEZI|nr:hypothetical protein CCUS01_02644 [Colletotrichum cuscutae]